MPHMTTVFIVTLAKVMLETRWSIMLVDKPTSRTVKWCRRVYSQGTQDQDYPYIQARLSLPRRPVRVPSTLKTLGLW